MKHFAKKQAAILLIALFALAACQSPLEPPENVSRGNAAGNVLISIGGSEGSTARTLSPGDTALGGLAYQLTFSGSDGASHAAESLTFGTPKTVQLAQGNWTITAQAKTGSTVKAEGTWTGEVSSGGTTEVSITLLPKTGSGSGTLAYTVSFPVLGTGGSKSLALYAVTESGETGEGAPVTNFTSGTPATVSLPAGFYRLSLSLTNSSGKTAARTNAVHIYAGLSTTAAFSFTEDDFRILVTLSAGPAVPAAATATTADVTFTGATGLPLSAADFAVDKGGTVDAVSVSGDTATVSVRFAANLVTTSKTYTVSIASDSAVITGSGNVTINQAASATDLRTELTAWDTVNVAAPATTANVFFTGATGLSLSLAKDDFAVSYGGTISAVSVSGDTAMVSVSFAANTSIMAAKTYIVSIAPGSEKIKGGTAVTITQAKVIGNGTSMASAILLTLNTWANSSLAAGGEQWFVFIATAANQYIHVDFGTLTNLYVQLYDSGGNASGSSVRLYSSTTYTGKSVNIGNVYYIKVSPYSSSYNGTYKIGFTTSAAVNPDTAAVMASATQLTLNTWTNGELTVGAEQWFKFTATATNQYIHIARGTLTELYVRLYDSVGNALGSSNLIYSSSNQYVNLSVTSGSVYYIRVWPYSSSYSGTYKIGFTMLANATPDTVAAMASATVLTLNSWTNDEFAAYESHWFKFTATAANQYIHIARGTLTELYVQLHNSAGNALGNSYTIYSSSNQYVNLSVTSGSVYYIKVWPYSSSYSGTYKIGFTTSTTPPSQ